MIGLKKVAWASLGLLCLLLTSCLVNCRVFVWVGPVSLVAGADGPVAWTVDDNGPANFSRIQDAVNDASGGDTIFVHNGTYHENVVVNKSLSIAGESVDFTVVEGFQNDSVVTIVANGVSFSGFTVRKSGSNVSDSGVRLDHSNGCVISNNRIMDNRYGVSVYFSSGNTVVNNSLVSNGFYGVSFFVSSDGNVVSGNSISGSYAGVFFLSSSQNVVSNNLITDNQYGVLLYSSGGNVVFGNNVLSNSFGGISLMVSGDNVVYHNNFNNTNQTSCDLANYWSLGGEGNYWSDYSGRDLTGDGIGDEPYIVGVNNRDNCPLMGMFSGFWFFCNRLPYSVTVVSNSTISKVVFAIGAETGNKRIQFNVTGRDGSVGFCRIMIPTGLMNDPLIVLVGEDEIVPTLLSVSNASHTYLYFTYSQSSRVLTVISSKTLGLYNELFDYYAGLELDLHSLNVTYLQLLVNYGFLLGNYSMLQNEYAAFNASYNEYLQRYSEMLQNFKSMLYVIVAVTGVLVVTIVYLSRHPREHEFERSRIQ